MNRVILVGEAPSKNEVTETPIAGRIGRRLAACAGLSFDEYMARFERVNLLHVRQDTKAKGFEFNAAAAEREALRLRTTWGSFRIAYNPRVVILLGKRVARAFGVPQDYFTLHRLDHEFYVLPHPSGINRWFNEPANTEKFSAFLKEIIRLEVAK